MVEQVFKFSTGNEKAVEKLIMDENVHYIHMVFNKEEGLPEHYSNSNVYMIIIKGKMNIKLDDQELHQYSVGEIINIPYHTKMNVYNEDESILEFIVVKAPNPRNYVRNEL